MEQHAAHRVQHEDGIDGLARPLDAAHMVERLAHRMGRGHGDDLRRHQRADGALGIGEQTVEPGAGLGVEPAHQREAVGRPDGAEEVGRPVGGHAGEQRRRQRPVEGDEDVGAALERRLVENLHRMGLRQRGERRGGLRQRQIVEAVDDVRHRLHQDRQGCGTAEGEAVEGEEAGHGMAPAAGDDRTVRQHPRKG